MKKLLLILIAVISVSVLNAQTDKGTAGKAPAENPADPMVNGMPYSQWKAKQDQLKQQKAAKDAALIAEAKKQTANDDIIAVSPGQAKSTQAEKQTYAPPVDKSTPELGKPSTPAIKVTEDAPAKVSAISTVKTETKAPAQNSTVANDAQARINQFANSEQMKNGGKPLSPAPDVKVLPAPDMKKAGTESAPAEETKAAPVENAPAKPVMISDKAAKPPVKSE